MLGRFGNEGARSGSAILRTHRIVREASRKSDSRLWGGTRWSRGSCQSDPYPQIRGRRTKTHQMTSLAPTIDGPSIGAVIGPQNFRRLPAQFWGDRHGRVEADGPLTTHAHAARFAIPGSHREASWAEGPDSEQPLCSRRGTDNADPALSGADWEKNPASVCSVRSPQDLPTFYECRLKTDALWSLASRDAIASVEHPVSSSSPSISCSELAGRSVFYGLKRFTMFSISTFAFVETRDRESRFLFFRLIAQIILVSCVKIPFLWLADWGPGFLNAWTRSSVAQLRRVIHPSRNEMLW